MELLDHVRRYRRIESSSLARFHSPHQWVLLQLSKLVRHLLLVLASRFLIEDPLHLEVDLVVDATRFEREIGFGEWTLMHLPPLEEFPILNQKVKPRSQQHLLILQILPDLLVRKVVQRQLVLVILVLPDFDDVRHVVGQSWLYFKEPWDLALAEVHEDLSEGVAH